MCSANLCGEAKYDESEAEEMKIVRYRFNGRTEYGIQEGEVIQALVGSPFRGITKAGRSVKAADVRLLAPCLPSKVLAIGASYRSHCLEMGQPILDEPMMFFKPSTSVVGPEAKLVRPQGVKRFDYEAEVGVVMKRRAFKVKKEKAEKEAKEEAAVAKAVRYLEGGGRQARVVGVSRDDPICAVADQVEACIGFQVHTGTGNEGDPHLRQGFLYGRPDNGGQDRSGYLGLERRPVGHRERRHRGRPGGPEVRSPRARRASSIGSARRTRAACPSSAWGRGR